MNHRAKVAVSLAAAAVLGASVLYALAEQHCASRDQAFLLHRMRCVPLAPPPIVIERDLRHS